MTTINRHRNVDPYKHVPPRFPDCRDYDKCLTRAARRRAGVLDCTGCPRYAPKAIPFIPVGNGESMICSERQYRRGGCE